VTTTFLITDMKQGFISLLIVATLNSAAQESIKISDDLELLRISENAFIHVSYVNSPSFGRYSSNGLVFINGSEAFLFDTPPDEQLTITLVSWLREKMKVEIKGFAPNHWHEDCMGGLGYLNRQGTASYAGIRTIEIAREKDLPVPGHGFNDSLTVKLGDRSIFLYYPGAAHSMDNIVAWIPSEKILFAGCMGKSLASTNLGNTADGDLKEYASTIMKVIKRFPDAKVVVPGHGKAGGMELLTHTASLAEAK
jgi:metallo-beta-lactamase class B